MQCYLERKAKITLMFNQKVLKEYTYIFEFSLANMDKYL